MTSVLVLIYTAFRILILVVIGISVPVAGIWSIYHSQSDNLTKPYHEHMYLGMGIIATVVGLVVAWACLARVVHIYRAYNND